MSKSEHDQFCIIFDSILSNRKLSDRGLAKLLECSPTTIGNWRSGKHHPHNKDIHHIVDVLNLSHEQARLLYEAAGYRVPSHLNKQKIPIELYSARSDQLEGGQRSETNSPA